MTLDFTPAFVLACLLTLILLYIAILLLPIPEFSDGAFIGFVFSGSAYFLIFFAPIVADTIKDWEAFE